MKLETTIATEYDHSTEDYIKEGSELLIECLGHYTVAELELKISLLKEAKEVIGK